MLRLDLNLLWTILNVLIIFFLMKRFLFKPIHNILDKRQEEINKQYEEARLIQDKAGELKTQYENSLTGAAEEKTQIIAKAREKASVEYESILKSARVDADKVLSDARTEADKEQKKRMQEAQSQIAELVLTATAKIVAAKANEDSDRELYNQFIAKAGEKIE